MTSSRHTLAALCLLSILPRSALGQARLLPGEVLPVLSGVMVELAIDLSTRGVFEYSYSITNPPASTGRVRAIEIDISKASNTIALGSEGIDNDRSVIQSVADTTRVVPVGFRSPLKWIAATSVRQSARWGAVADDSQIAPNMRQSGFKLLSQGPPAIRHITLHPKFIQTPVEDAGV